MSAGLGVRRDPWILCGGGALLIVALYWTSPFFHCTNIDWANESICIKYKENHY